MVRLNIIKKKLNMNNLIIKRNEHLKDELQRKEMVVEAALASSKLEGIHISKEMAQEISIKVEADLKKFLR
jgi:hypothetical protein